METTNFYKAKSKVKMHLNQWISDDNRDDFSDWCFKQNFGERFGFSEKTVKKIFEEFFPTLTIDPDGQPIKRIDHE